MKESLKFPRMPETTSDLLPNIRITIVSTSWDAGDNECYNTCQVLVITLTQWELTWCYLLIF